MTRAKKWDDDRDERLRKMWPTEITAEAIGQSLGGFSQTAVLHRSKELGLPRRSSFSWTDEKVEELKRLKTEGYENSEIAVRFGLTVNAIIGKLYRVMGTPPRKQDGRRDPQSPILFNRRVAKGKVRKFVLAPSKPIKKGNGKPVTILKAGFGQCRYVLGEVNGPHTLVCGDPVKDGLGSWCDIHAQGVFHQSSWYKPVKVVG